MKISTKVKSVVKFEAKLILAVAILATLVYFGTHALIARSAEYVANAYTQDLK
jgi:hypothetical protein